MNAQEAAYNMGRAAHQLGLLHLAAPFYEQALACSPQLNIRHDRPAASAIIAQPDVSREAAHNLVLVYKATGAVALARQVMLKHLII
jgi:general transcription factor 3C polypeptide 3 (transcription factor C subunit 4)